MSSLSFFFARHSLVRILYILGSFLIMFQFIVGMLPAYAISEDDFNSIITGTPFYDPDAIGSDCSDGTLPSSIPVWGSQIFTNAAALYGVPPALVATIYWSEHGGSWQEPPPPYGNGIPYASSGIGPAWPSGLIGAVGPFQFQYATWLEYLNANPNHQIDSSDDQAVAQSAEDLTDAAFGAAKELASLGGTTGAAIGSLSNTLQPDTIVNAIRAYDEGATATDPDLSYVTPALETYNSLTGIGSSCAVSIGNGVCLTDIQGDGDGHQAASWQPLCPWIPQGGYPDIYPGGQCTWWAAYNFDPFPVGSQNGGGSPENLSNGADWYANATEMGVPTHPASDGPRVGEIVSFSPNGGTSGVTNPAGHVAIIIAVAADGASFTVSEAHAPVLWQVDTNTYKYPDKDINGFIGPDQAAISWLASHPGSS